MLLLLDLVQLDDGPVHEELRSSVVKSGGSQSMRGAIHHDVGSGRTAGG